MIPSPSPRPNRIPVSVITGFLGSGKTTLINHLVKQPAMADTALIINEFGEIGLDHMLVESSIENTVLMESGCICCTIRGDLVDTVLDLFTKQSRGDIPPFGRIAIETTGLANPLPILQTLMREEALAERCRLEKVVVTVDGVQALGQLSQHCEVEQQFAVADVALLTKADLAGERELGTIEDRLHALQPGLPVHRIRFGRVDPEVLFGDGRFGDAVVQDGEHEHRHEHRHEHEHEHGHDHGDEHAHAPDGDIRSESVTVDAPLAWIHLRNWLESIFSLRGDRFLRFKGLANVDGCAGPVLLHAVGPVFSPPEVLDAWPGGDAVTRLVFITKGLPEGALAASFEHFVIGRQGGP